MSFFPISVTSPNGSTSTTTHLSDDPHLQVTVTPFASAFFAGEEFGVRITFTNTRLGHPPPPTPTTAATADVVSAVRPVPPLSDRQAYLPTLPKRCGRIGKDIGKIEEDGNAEAGPSRTPIMPSRGQVPSPDHAGYPYSPGADPTYRAPGWPSREPTPMIRGPEEWRRRELGTESTGRIPSGHSRRAKSLALGREMSPQEMVWALGGDRPSVTPSPPPLPSRRAVGNGIPSHHPHSRKISVISPPMPSAPLPSGVEHDAIPEETHAPYTAPELSHGRYRDSSPSSSQSQVDLTDDPRLSMDQSRPRLKRAPSSGRPPHIRRPSYQNAYGASSLGALGPPPPIHPDIRKQDAVGTTNVLWAYTRLVARFHPSNTYIPPDPLLPLRAMLLHQPVGSGSLVSANDADQGSSSRWQLSFGTGTIGNDTQPTLTGSLFGLAKSIVSGGAGGTLEEERKRVWNMKDLPVLETARSLLGVDIKLKEGETQSFTYTFPLPEVLPPTFRGKAFRFSYDLVVSVNVALPGKGNRQKTKDVTVPIRVWSHVSMSNPSPTYDILTPVIQTKDNGVVVQDVDVPKKAGEGEDEHEEKAAKASNAKVEKTREALQVYANQLLDNADPPKSPGPLPPSPTDSIKSPTPDIGTLDLNGSTQEPLVPATDATDGTLVVPDPLENKVRPRKGSFIDGEDDVPEGLRGRCGEAVQVLSRHSPKRSYNIEEDGDPVAVFNLFKTTYRLGESVLGVLDFNGAENERRVLRFAAYLESHEVIPENLLSDPTAPAQPKLTRLHAEHCSGYTLHTSRLSFSLDIPSDATPEFSLSAGPEGAKGGVEWKIRLVFLVSVPNHRHRSRKSMDERKRPTRSERGESMVELRIDQGRQKKARTADSALYTASRSLAPVVVDDEGEWAGKTEVMVVEIPVRVLAGNTAFLVKPTVSVF